MKIKIIRQIALLSLLAYLPLQSMAWGLLGHRVVGEIAQDYLKKRTQREIKNILGNESLAMASNWADFIKSEPAYNYLSNWHYINLPAGLTSDRLQSYLLTDTVTDAYTKIRFLSSELKDRSLDKNKKIMYLRLLIHLVGDLHQPMHTGRFEDLGGNKVQVTWFGQPSNLHRIWDSDLIDSQELSYTEYARSINFIDKPRLFQLQNEDINLWVEDSYKISEKIYANVKTGDKLSYRYIYDYIGVADQQLLKGGIHLAALLNDIFK
ncbi:MAG: S1/P1 nuclease [Daejeonella sp.]|uniref:S1/P1 nuclease n=1 Tax=Daejeonella sp. JGW-45 TaxID=3034148 RepID=UPI0023EBDBB5|nr:S1/P1 nuclease [Daejeonella sp. JGW-45]